MTRLLVISNGIGEDSIGAQIVRRLPRSIAAQAYPTLGDGSAYRGICAVVGPRARLPSEGSRVEHGTLARDVVGGGLATIPPGLRFLRRSRNAYDRVLVIGDFIGVGACWLAGIRGVVYLDVYNSGYGRTYRWGEKRIIRRVCRTVFCRSETLAASLRALGVDARAAGNVMMDAIPDGEYDAARRRLRLRAVTLLPGSRGGTIANFVLQVEAIAALPEALRPDVFVAVADGIEPEQLAREAGLFYHPPAGQEGSDLGRLSGRGLHLNLARGALGPIVRASDIVLSQAGTATIQALGLGRPVVTFVRDTERQKRVREESLLFGEARLLVPAEAGAISAAVGRLLGDPAELARLGKSGSERIGGPGAINEIVATLTTDATDTSSRPAVSASPSSP